MNWSRSWSKFCDFDWIVPNPLRSASGPWCWVGRSVMFLFDCWLAGWPFISNPWCGLSVGHVLVVGRWVGLCLGRFGGVTVCPLLLDFIIELGRNHTLNPGEDRFPYSTPGSGAIEPLISCRRWRSSELLMESWRRRSLEF
ncbi:hypothetical protein DY000_02031508 [Brassica cretica]|uniref:Uncharacterized protein n=1 Tax=Brassica cretica TaxID=69181 RepID=A0ABQ7DVL8_BRACR|nr:hypothetical protein DY000_02031508 [Brassica cretica]